MDSRYLKNSLIWVVLYLILITIGCSDDNSTGPDDTPRLNDSKKAAIQDMLEVRIDSMEIPGAAMLIVTPDGELWSCAAGINQVDNLEDYPVDREWTGTPFTTDLHTRIGSLTKSFTSTLVLKLCEDGLIELDEVVDTYLPDIVPNSDIITIRQLLNMSAGLVDYSSVPELENLDWPPTQHFNPQDLIAISIEGGGTSFEPGTSWEYSNTNYILLGMILESVSGNTYADLVEQLIIEPAALENTYVPTSGEAEMPAPFVYGYSSNLNAGEYWDEQLYSDMSWAYSAGNIVSHLEDLYTWMKICINGDLLNENMHNEMWNCVPMGIPGFEYGCGVMETTSGMHVMGHNGGMPGYETSAFKYEDVYIVVMTNGNPTSGTLRSSDDIANNAISIIYGS